MVPVPLLTTCLPKTNRLPLPVYTYLPNHPSTIRPHARDAARLVDRCGWRGLTGRTCLAISRDGVQFSKPPIARSQSTDRSIRGRWTNIVLETSKNEAFEVVYPNPNP